MKCIYCSAETQVLDSRDSEHAIRRRRECTACGKRFTTYERAETDLLVIKKDGRREKYDSEKLKKGVLKACEKRPISLEEIEKMLDAIENEIREEKEIKSSKIGKLVMRRLKSMDKVAYIRFASVYHEFADIDEFEDELKKLKK
ncbi:MAG: transcriptional repressor NrdR [Candidatus Aenigmarchaeota archaeon]|nr:transcriptional repressor NrdR [Candidatus Aenigmarchaeota archaeon]